MTKTIAAVVLSLFLGFALASWVRDTESEAVTPPVTAMPADSPSFDSQLPVEVRLRALEQAVSEERYARQVLEEEVWYLSGELMQVTGVAPTMPPPAAASEGGDSSRESRRESYRRRNSVEGRMERLIEAGFLPSQASMIMQRESELQMESLQARWEAERSGDPDEYWRNRGSTNDALRAELGDADYERYLAANGRPTSITVSSVIESSPAQSAGLVAGDEIVRYAGERVFSMSDLTRQTMEGAAGETIVVDIMRDGTPMQVALPRGPVGISGGRRSR